MFSKRIKNIASLVDKDKKIIDIGCDHGLLDIYLTWYNNNECIASDINKNALQNAKNNFKKYNLNIPTILSDGFNNVKEDVDIAIITGMGTNTILNILEHQKTANINTLIIQSNNDHYLLRKELTKKGYFIKDEITFSDKKVNYIIIKFEKGKKIYSNTELLLGPILISKNDNDTKKYFLELLQKNQEILKKIPKKYIFKKYKILILNSKIKKLI